jgi:two-component system heavy metal sensor histidine kinase CusS
MLRRALSNLLDNALRFTPAAGEIRVTLEPGLRMWWPIRAGDFASAAAVVRPLLPRRSGTPGRQQRACGVGLGDHPSIVQAHGEDQGECANGWTRFVIELPEEELGLLCPIAGKPAPTGLAKPL